MLDEDGEPNTINIPSNVSMANMEMEIHPCVRHVSDKNVSTILSVCLVTNPKYPILVFSNAACLFSLFSTFLPIFLYYSQNSQNYLSSSPF